MAEKFDGTLDELKEVVTQSGVVGNWEDEGMGKHTFRSAEGGVLNWWPSNGTLNFQGKQKAKGELAGIFNASPKGGTASAQPDIRALGGVHRQIFIVHGHDVEARDQLELVLHRLALQPFVLMNNSGGGKTIIEALEGQIGRDYTSDFGIVLMTPDDFGYAKKDGPDKAEPRARQNVVLEMGMLLSSLTRKRMAIVVKGPMEIPSDLQGIIRIDYNDHIREIVPKLCQNLKDAGFDIDPEKMAGAMQ